MYWNYRLLKTGAAYVLVEAYYEDGCAAPSSYATPHPLVADSLEEAAEMLKQAADACSDLPIAVNADGVLVEVK